MAHWHRHSSANPDETFAYIKAALPGIERSPSNGCHLAYKPGAVPLDRLCCFPNELFRKSGGILWLRLL